MSLPERKKTITDLRKSWFHKKTKNEKTTKGSSNLTGFCLLLGVNGFFTTFCLEWWASLSSLLESHCSEQGMWNVV